MCSRIYSSLTRLIMILHVRVLSALNHACPSVRCPIPKASCIRTCVTQRNKSRYSDLFTLHNFWLKLLFLLHPKNQFCTTPMLHSPRRSRSKLLLCSTPEMKCYVLKNSYKYLSNQQQHSLFKISWHQYGKMFNIHPICNVAIQKTQFGTARRLDIG